MSLNKAILIGRLTKDIELKKTPNGTSVVQFTIACNRDYNSDQQETDFINCVAWSGTADNMARYCYKGMQIAVVGRIQVRSYDNQYGNKVYVTEIVCERVQFLESRKSNENNYNSNYTNQQKNEPQQEYNEVMSEFNGLAIDDNELPF